MQRLSMRCRSLLLFLALLLLSLPAWGNTDQTLYDDSLQNDWENWSWCSVDFSAGSYVHSGSKSVKATFAAGYQGFYLHHTPFSTTPYRALTFWIHGGGVDWRNTTIRAYRNNVEQAYTWLNYYIAGHAFSGSEWRRVTIPLSDLGIANKTDVTGFTIQDASGGAQPAFYIDDIALTTVMAPSTVRLTVNAGQTLRTVDERIFGANAVIWDNQFEYDVTPNLLTEMDNRTLRFPGGSMSNGYHWKTGTTDNNTWQWATNFDDFAKVAVKTKAQVFISVNYGSSTAQDAADWVRYANITKGYGFKYWEIGNENYGTWERDDNNRPHDPYTYATRAADYITRMKAIDPTIKIGVVVTNGEDSYVNYTDRVVTNPRTGVSHKGWTPVMLARLRALGITPDFVVYHRYAQSPGWANDQSLLISPRT